MRLTRIIEQMKTGLRVISKKLEVRIKNYEEVN